jgi:hypothetical protein
LAGSGRQEVTGGAGGRHRQLGQRAQVHIFYAPHLGPPCVGERVCSLTPGGWGRQVVGSSRAASDLTAVAFPCSTCRAWKIRPWRLAAAGWVLVAVSARSQDYHQQETYRGTLSGVYVRVTAATDRGLEISAGKPPDHVQLSAVLPEAAASWADSGLRVLGAPDSAPVQHAPVTISGGMLVDSTHNATSLDRVLYSEPAACSLFFADGANLNHVRADVPCATAQQFLEGVRRAAALQVTYDQSDSTSPAAAAARALRAAGRRQDSLGLAAQLNRHRDSAAGAIP